MSNHSSPAIAPSPVATTPCNNIKPATSVTKIITSKEWVLPPRPKPGRKPSADTPATKRKAQNRAAQRAFRERRATRVQELEEKLMEIQKEKEVEELNFKNTIGQLNSENKLLMKTLKEMKSEFNNFKKQFIEDKNNSNKLSPLSTSYSPKSYPLPLPQPQPSQQIRSSSSSSAPSPQLRHQPISPATRSPRDLQNQLPIPNIKQIQTLVSKPTVSIIDDDKPDCGVCIKDDCICAAVGIRDSPPIHIQQQQTKPSTIDMLPVSLKRRTEEIEIDYTAKFSKKSTLLNKPMPKLKRFKKQERPAEVEFSNVFTGKDFESPLEQCGFCSDDSPCVCREAAKEAANAITELQNQSRTKSVYSENTENTLPPISRHSSVSSIQKLPVFHPGPSVEISGISTPPPPTKPSSADKSSGGGCTGNPGTCSQCQMDPMSTLFCTTIASKAEEEEHVKEQEKKSPVSPPLSKISSPVQDNELNSIQRSNLLTPTQSNGSFNSSDVTSLENSKGIYIPCADAYKTLSRHKEFNSVDFSTLVGKLTTRGMQVEVQSVANVLRELDKRVYS
ncbi:hypothetical protein WICMUC_002535 [Wickerhamomyces mucosus]|uniref:BZIP domain-containing protein n=1 Tax=Wickerhamomyces mucosus TaxID=1378264 RepID=A0A9P8PP77_9ASCO|nr:hypothetical protein WICMUC_002535 [Wickerhamomyces mucosus]